MQNNSIEMKIAKISAKDIADADREQALTTTEGVVLKTL